MPLVDLSERWIHDSPMDRTVPELEETPVSALDVAAAAARKVSYSRALLDASPTVNLLRRAAGFPKAKDPEPVAGYDVLNDPQMKGREDYYNQVLWSESPLETHRTLEQIRVQEMDNRALQQAGWGGVAASIGFIASDPLILASTLVPVAPVIAGATRAQRVLAGVASQVAFDAAGEAALHAQQPLRTAGETAFNVAAGALMVGTMGAIVTRVPKTEFEAARKELAWAMHQRRIAVPAASTVGASATKVATTLDDETIATLAARFLAKTLGHISPVDRVMQSSSRAARATIQKLSEVPYLLKKHLRDIPSEDSIDTLVKRVVNAGRYEAVRLADEAFLEYRQGGGTLGRKQFMEFVSDAANLGDSSTIPQVAKVAQWARKVLDEDRETLRLVGVDIDDHVLGAKSYFPHVHDIPKIIADRTAAEAKLFTWFRANPKIPAGGDVTEAARTRVSALVAKRWELKQQDLADDAAPILEVDKQLAEAREALAAKRGELQEGVPRAQANLAVAEKEAAEAKAALEQELGALGKQRETATEAAKAAKKQSRKLVSLNRRAGLLTFKLKYLNSLLEAPEAAAETAAARLEALRAEISTAQRELTASRKRLGDAQKTYKLQAVVSTQQVNAEYASRLKAARAERQDLLANLKAAGGDTASLRQAVAANKAAIAKLTTDRATEAKAARVAARRQVADARTAHREIYAGLTKLRAERRMLNTPDAKQARISLTAEIEKLSKRIAASKKSHAKAKPLAKEARKLASEILKKAKAQKKVVRKTRKVKTKKAETARRAVPPELDDVEVGEQVKDTIEHILHMPTGRVFTPAGKPSPLKSRVLDIPYEIWKDYLVRDFETVMAGYFRSVAPEILLRQKFGSVDLKKEFDEIAEDFRRMENAASSDKAKHEINKERDKVVTDTKHILDRLLGHVGPTNEAAYGHGSHWVRSARVLRTYAYVRSLGAQMLSSMADVGKLIARYGMTKTLATTAEFLVNWNANKLTRAQNHRMGTAISMVVDTRSHQIGDIMDELPTTRLERGLQLTANTFSKLTLMSPWNAMIQHLSAIMEQDEILRAVRGGKMSRVQKATLVRFGITEADYPKLAEAFERWGEDLDGVFRARTDLWDPAYKDLALKVETAVLKAGDEILSARGVGDLPIFMDNEFAKTLLQFKTFAITSVNRTMIPVVQGLALKDARTAQGVLSMMTMGILIYYTKELAAGYKPSTDPERLIAEAFNWSGMMGYLPELWDPIAVSVNLANEEGVDLLPRFSRFKSRSWMETMAGPTFGSTGRLTQSLIRSITNGDLEQKDLTTIKMMLPYRNWFPVTRLLNAIEGEVGEQIGAEGATHKEFWDRAAELRPER